MPIKESDGDDGRCQVLVTDPGPEQLRQGEQETKSRNKSQSRQKKVPSASHKCSQYSPISSPPPESQKPLFCRLKIIYMKVFDWKKLLPHLIAIISFIVLAALFSKPALEGKVLYQHDIVPIRRRQPGYCNYAAKHGQPPCGPTGCSAECLLYRSGCPATMYCRTTSIPCSPLGAPADAVLFLACILFYFLSAGRRGQSLCGHAGILLRSRIRPSTRL